MSEAINVYEWLAKTDSSYAYSECGEKRIPYKQVVNFPRVSSCYAKTQCVMCGKQDVNIPSQNKSICNHCDSKYWKNEEFHDVFKFCKGCKNFNSLAAFIQKPNASKCDKCRSTIKQVYKQKVSTKKNMDSPQLPNTSERKRKNSTGSQLEPLQSENSASNASVAIQSCYIRPPKVPRKVSLSPDGEIPKTHGAEYIKEFHNSNVGNDHRFVRYDKENKMNRLQMNIVSPLTGISESISSISEQSIGRTLSERRNTDDSSRTFVESHSVYLLDNPLLRLASISQEILGKEGY